jgi:transcriptional regulator protein, marR family
MNNSKMERYEMHFNIEIARTISLAYNVVCKPICKELDLPQTAFDILMFLGNNPKYKTAGEIVEIRHIKANLVSVNVDKLVREGYLERKTVEGDRRKTELICTEKAMAVISRGREIQREFLDKMLANLGDGELKAFLSALGVIKGNLNAILEEEDKK